MYFHKNGFVLTDALICVVIAISMCTVVFYTVKQEYHTNKSIEEKMLESDAVYISEIQSIESIEAECAEKKCEETAEEKDSY